MRKSNFTEEQFIGFLKQARCASSYLSPPSHSHRLNTFG